MSQPASPDATVSLRAYRTVLVCAVLVAAMIALTGGLTRAAAFSDAGNDDIMRLMSVRDWLGGQSWFNMTQYRIVPPDGLSLHWSRYVDAAIAAMLLPLSAVLSIATAEHVLAVLWPLTLLLLLMLIIGNGTRHLLGNGAAAIAVVTVVAYPPLAAGYFGNGRFDHHNVQIILMALAALSLARRDQPVWLGLIAGTVSAMSLAVGLEALFMVVAISLLHVLDAAFAREGARRRLTVFCISLLGVSVLAFIGQTPVAKWGVQQCDQLALPILTLAGVGVAGAGAALMIPFAKGRPAAFLGFVGAVAVIGLLLAWPVIGPCLQSPYANLSVETQTFISTQIAEALPLLVFAAKFPAGFANSFGPPLTVLILGSVMWAITLRNGHRQPGIGHLLLIGWLGVFASFWQMRQVVILAAVTPVLAGYVVAPFLRRRIEAPSPRRQLALYAVIVATVGQPLLARGIEVASVKSAPIAGEVGVFIAQQDAACSSLAVLEQLNALPAGVILASMNLGPKLIMKTHHAAISAPYHRSAAALENGFVLKRTDAAEVVAVMRSNAADLLLVCEGSQYGTADSVGSRLARGEAVGGFVSVLGIAGPLLVFETSEAS